MSYTVKIIDDDTGDIVIDRNDAVAIIGSIVLPEGTQGIYSTSCEREEAAMCIYGAQRAINMGKKSDPLLGALVAYIESKEDELPSTVVDLSPLKRKRKNGD